jgi:filamentous hemagglutinin
MSWSRALQLVTESDTAFFWSGRSGSFRAGVEAPRIASTNNGVTMEMIIEQRGVKMPIYDPSEQPSIKAWANVSMEYANGCKGNVRAVIGRNTRPDSIWLTTELPALKAKPHVP